MTSAAASSLSVGRAISHLDLEAHHKCVNCDVLGTAIIVS